MLQQGWFDYLSWFVRPWYLRANVQCVSCKSVFMLETFDFEYTYHYNNSTPGTPVQFEPRWKVYDAGLSTENIKGNCPSCNSYQTYYHYYSPLLMGNRDNISYMAYSTHAARDAGLSKVKFKKIAPIKVPDTEAFWGPVIALACDSTNNPIYDIENKGADNWWCFTECFGWPYGSDSLDSIGIESGVYINKYLPSEDIDLTEIKTAHQEIYNYVKILELEIIQ